MGIITLKEVRRRSKLDILSDKELPFYDPYFGGGTVRSGQKRMENKYQRHEVVRRLATEYLLMKGYDVYPKGVTVNGAGTCPDLAFFRGKHIIFVECLTEGWVYHFNTLKKRRIERFAPIVFFIENKPLDEFNNRYKYRRYLERVRRLAAKCSVWWCNPITKKVNRFKEN